MELQKAGLGKKESCQVLTFPRSTFYRKKEGPLTKVPNCSDDKSSPVPMLVNGETESFCEVKLLQEIKEIIKAHPFWGYRRVWAYLRYRRGLLMNKKRVLRIMKVNGLLKKVKSNKPARKTRDKPVAQKPNEFWGTDMSKFLVPSLGWVSFVIVLDWYSKKILGYSIGLRGDTGLWLEALNNAVLEAFPETGAKGRSVKLISDNGSQPTSGRYLADCKSLDIEQIFTTYNNPKGDADTERCIRTVKEEAVWPYEFETLDEARQKLAEQITFYNERYCHSSISYKSPNEFLREFNEKQGIKIAA